MPRTVEKVACQILEKLGDYVSDLPPENLRPQAMKPITATLKDIRDLQEAAAGEGLSVQVEFSREDWCD